MEEEEDIVTLSQKKLLKCDLSLSKRDIRTAPSNWLLSHSEEFDVRFSPVSQVAKEGWTKLWVPTHRNSKTMTLLDHAFSDSSMKINEAPDFIGASQSLKKLFSIPYTDQQVSLMIHRVGKTMLVNSVKPNETPKVDDFSKTPQISFSIPLEPATHSGSAESAQGLESNLLYYSCAAPAVQRESPEKDIQGDTRDASFTRTLRWSFQNLSVLVGSNLAICEDQAFHEKEFSVRLHDTEQDLASSQCLDFYLDNRLAGVDALALCLHAGGFVRDFRLIKTDDIPLLAEKQNFNQDSFRTHRSFSNVEERAAELLKFLRDRCDPECSYWLFKDVGRKNFVRLYELSPHKNEQRWMYTMAMLCFRVAQQFKSSTERERIERHRELLLKCLELLDTIANRNGPNRYVLRAALHEQIANNYFEAIPTYNSTQRKEVLRSINFSLAHWQNVRTFLQEEKRGTEEAGETLEEAIEKFHIRMEKQVLSCIVQACAEHRKLGQHLLGGEILVNGMLNALLSKVPPVMTIALQVLGDTCIDIAKRIIAKESFITSDLDRLITDISKILAVDSSANDKVAIIVDGPSDTVLLQKIMITAIMLYKISLSKGNGGIRAELKLGNAWNELGKLRLGCNNYEAAKEAYEAALQTFQHYGDCINSVACLCNLNHLERTMGFARTKGTSYSLDDFLPFERAVSHLGVAESQVRGAAEGADSSALDLLKMWTIRVEKELAMTRLIYGCRLKEACIYLCEQRILEHTKFEALHKKLVKELHSAISIYEHYMANDSASREQAAAVHYHLGTHYAWCLKDLNDTQRRVVTKSSSKKTISTLAKRHLQLAVESFPAESTEREQSLAALVSL